MSNTTINDGLLHVPVEQNRPSGIGYGLDFAKSVHELMTGKNTVQSLLGNASIVQREGVPFPVTSFAHAMAGTTLLVNQTLMEWSSTTIDPMRVCLGQFILDEEKLLFVRDYIAEGGIDLVSERGMARAPSVMQDAREMRTELYAGAIDMSLEMFLNPEKAAKEFTMKLESQKAAINRKGTTLAYRHVRQQGTPIMTAYMDTIAANGSKSHDELMVMADRMYRSDIFACMHKCARVMPAIMSVIQRANVYSQTDDIKLSGPAVITPPGHLDISQLTKMEHMDFYLSGLKENEVVKVPVTGPTVLIDPTSGVRVLIHWPHSSSEGPRGAAGRQVYENLMESIATFATYYNVGEANIPDKDGEISKDRARFCLTDFDSENWKSLSVKYSDFTSDSRTVIWDKDEERYMVVDATRDEDGNIKSDEETGKPCNLILLRPNMVMRMEDMFFFSKTGLEVGAYVTSIPHTTYSANSNTKVMRMQLHLKMSTFLFRNECVYVIPHVKCNGIESGANTRIAPHWNPTPGCDLIATYMLDGDTMTDVIERLIDAGHTNIKKDNRGEEDDDEIEENKKPIPRWLDVGEGTVADRTRKVVKVNNSHLGVLDHPFSAATVKGMAPSIKSMALLENFSSK